MRMKMVLKDFSSLIIILILALSNYFGLLPIVECVSTPNEKLIIGLKRQEQVNEFLIKETYDSIEASFDERFGIDLIAKKDYKKGELVFSCSPVGAISFLPKCKNMCENCGRYSTCSSLKFSCDSNCGTYFCSSHCKYASQTWHTNEECDAFAYMDSYIEGKPKDYFWAEVHEFSRIIIRILTERYLQTKQLMNTNYSSKKQKYLSNAIILSNAECKEHFVGDHRTLNFLCTNENEFKQHPQHLRHAQEVFQAVSLALPSEYLLQKREIVSLVFSISCNRFGLRCPGDCLGTGMFPLSALINHSCVPNLTRIHIGKVMFFYACKDIQAGSKLMHSYVDLRQGLQERKSELLTTYLFDCKCERCTIESKGKTYEEIREAWCTDCGRATVSLSNGFLAGCVCQEKDINAIRDNG